MIDSANSLNIINIYLCFSEFDGDPNAISTLIDVNPSSVHKKGEVRLGKDRPDFKTFWSALLAEEDGEDVGIAVDRSVDVLSIRSAEIARVSSRSRESYLGVTIRLGSAPPSINLSPETIASLAEMRLSLDIGLFS